MIASTILAAYDHDRRLRPHPDRGPQGTKYVKTYLTDSGLALAVEKLSDRGAVWVLARLVGSTDLPWIDRSAYAETEGRNSNLSVPELKGRPLVRLFAKDRTDATAILEHICAKS